MKARNHVALWYAEGNTWAIGYGALAGAIVGLLLSGCHHAQSNVPKTEQAVLALAQGVKLADLACADTALAINAGGKHDAAIALATACAGSVAAARASLLAAEVIAEGDGGALSVCATIPALDALNETVASIAGAGGVIGDALADAVRVASALGTVAQCPRLDAGK